MDLELAALLAVVFVLMAYVLWDVLSPLIGDNDDE